MRLTILLLLTSLLSSCDTQKVLVKSGQRKIRDYEIGQYNSGCCGCVALYYSLFDGKNISKQLIFELSCGMGSPTVFNFSKDSNEAVHDIHGFIAVSDSTAEFEFNAKEKMLLAKLDSVVAMHQIRVSKEFKFASLVGYRPKLTTEKFHIFWIDENGKSRSVLQPQK
jgi:hypothetical protein